MSATQRNVAVLALSLLAIWLGASMGKARPAATAGTPPDPLSSFPRNGPQPTRPATVANGQILTAAQSLRIAAGRCETGALWQWLLADPEANSLTRVQVVDELIDRLGAGAWTHVLALDDDTARTQLSEIVLARFSYRDPWLAYQMYLAERDSFGKLWGEDAVACIVGAAGVISADKLIEVMEDTTFPETRMLVHTDFPPGFDFQRLMDHLVSTGSQPAALPWNMLEEWATRSPLAAAQWLAAHPQAHLRGAFRSLDEPLPIAAVIKATATSTAPSREAALVALGRLPAEERERAWKDMSNETPGKLDPAILSAADAMGQRENHLVRALLQTRGLREIDPSWLDLPVDERARILDIAESELAARSSNPVDERARRHWRATLESAWGTP